MLQKLTAGFPDPPLEEVDNRIMRACRESILTCLRCIHVIAQVDINDFIRLSVTDRFTIRVRIGLVYRFLVDIMI